MEVMHGGEAYDESWWFFFSMESEATICFPDENKGVDGVSLIGA